MAIMIKRILEVLHCGGEDTSTYGREFDPSQFNGGKGNGKLILKQKKYRGRTTKVLPIINLFFLMTTLFAIALTAIYVVLLRARRSIRSRFLYNDIFLFFI